MEAGQATTWLRELLRDFQPAPQLTDLGTHSLKATVLSMMAKAGCDGDLRRLAGYHVDPGAKMALEYSRDAQAPVLHAIEAIGFALQHGLFDPDVSRTKRWPRRGCNSLQAVMTHLSGMSSEDFWYHSQTLDFGSSGLETHHDEGWDVLGEPEPYSPSDADEQFFDAESI